MLRQGLSLGVERWDARRLSFIDLGLTLTVVCPDLSNLQREFGW
jgi:hypothetical protein